MGEGIVVGVGLKQVRRGRASRKVRTAPGREGMVCRSARDDEGGLGMGGLSGGGARSERACRENWPGEAGKVGRDGERAARSVGRVGWARRGQGSRWAWVGALRHGGRSRWARGARGQEGQVGWRAVSRDATGAVGKSGERGSAWLGAVRRGQSDGTGRHGWSGLVGWDGAGQRRPGQGSRSTRLGPARTGQEREVGRQGPSRRAVVRAGKSERPGWLGVASRMAVRRLARSKPEAGVERGSRAVSVRLERPDLGPTATPVLSNSGNLHSKV